MTQKLNPDLSKFEDIQVADVVPKTWLGTVFSILLSRGETEIIVIATLVTLVVFATRVSHTTTMLGLVGLLSLALVSVTFSTLVIALRRTYVESEEEEASPPGDE